MREFTVTLLIVIISFPLCAEPLYQQKDKQKHFAVSAVIASIVTKVALDNGATNLEASFYGVGAALLVGAVKEGYDQYSYGGASIEDGYADLAGSLAGSALVIGYDWEF